MKGHRNGGSSNTAVSVISVFTSCERPPKWWFKQQLRAAQKPTSRCERPPKWWFKQPSLPSLRSRGCCERPPKWWFKQLSAMTSPRPAVVVKGHRNGGSSNLRMPATSMTRRCERPPKWWFKQLVSFLVDKLLCCERPPKWWFKQLDCDFVHCLRVVKGHRNGGSSNWARHLRR